MKKTLLLFVSLALTTLSALALPTKPEVKTFTPWALGAQGYLYNVDAGMFITNGTWWGTNACGASSSSTDDYDFEAVRLGNAKLSGNLFEVAEGNAEEGDATTYYALENKSRDGEVFLTFDGGNETDIWVDGGTDRAYDKWHVETNSDNTFKLIFTGYIDDVKTDNIAGFKKFGEGNIHVIMNTDDAPYTTWALVSAEVYDNVIDGLNLYYVAEKLNELVTSAKGQGISKDFSAYEAMLAADTTTYETYVKSVQALNPIVTLGKTITEAKALDAAHDWSSFEAIYASNESTAAEIDSTLTNLKAYISLKNKLDAALAEYSQLDFSAAKAVYDATGNTNEKLAAAEALIDDIIADYNMSQATLENPADITATISGIDGSSIDNWTRVFLGSGENGSLSCNTWSTEATEDGMVTPFIENWLAAGASLSDMKVYRNAVKVKPGAYKITAKARLFNESDGATYLTGAHVFANLNALSMTKPGVESAENAVEGAKYADYNGKLYYYKDDFEGYGIVTGDSSLIFGMYIKDANCNWLAHKNYKVYYLGESFESIDYVRKNSDLLADTYADNTIAQKSLVEEYNKAVSDYKNATTAEAISAGYAGISLLMDSVVANVAAYAAYIAETERISAYLNDVELAETDELNYLSDYLMDDVFSPEDDERFVNGNKQYILKNLLLSTEEITAEMESLGTILESAIRNGLVDGSDLTSLIANPGFEEAGGAGWSWDNAYSEPNNWHGGGVNNNYNAEAYEMNFDVYQIIENVPNGLYEVSVQAFYRTGENSVAWDAYQEDPEMEGKAMVYPEVYLNEFATKVRNTMEVQFDEPIGTDYWTTPDGTYTVNGVNSAAAAFGLDDPEKNFTMPAYGLVTDGKIRLGIRKTAGPTDGQVWTLWDNFKLTYRAKNETALQSVIESIMDQYNTYVGNNADYINALEADNVDEALEAAEEALTGDADEMYEGLIQLNAAYIATQAHVAAMVALYDAIDELSDALNNYSETATDEALQKASEVAEEAEDVDNLTTAEIIALTERINDVIPALKIPKDVGEASDENPVELTDLIVNADFAVEFGESGYGWEYTKNGGNGPSYTDAFEFWNGSGAQELRFNIWQDIKALPAGKYELTAVAANSLNGQADLNNPGRAFLYASTFVTEDDATTYSSDSVRITEGDANNAANQDEYSVIFTVEEGQTVRVGFKSSGVMTARWFIGKDFHLWYYGTASEKEDSGDLSGVEALEADKAEIVAIYTVSGVQVATLQKGINIVKYADGTTKKIIVQ